MVSPFDSAWSILKFGYPGGIPGADYSQSRAGDGMRGAGAPRQAQADATVPPVFNPKPRILGQTEFEGPHFNTDISHVARTTDMSGRPFAPSRQFKNAQEMFEAMGRSPFTSSGDLPRAVSDINRSLGFNTGYPKSRLPVAQAPIRENPADREEQAIGEYLEALKRERMHRARQMME